MKRKFIVNLIFLVLLNLLIKPFWFLGIDVTVQNRVNNAEYGIYFSLLSFTIIFNILLDLGITNFNNREIARNNILLSKYFSNILGIKIILGIFYSLFCIIIGLIIGYDSRHFSLLFLLIFNQFLSSLILYLRSNINGLLMFITDSILSVLDKSLMILFCGALLWSGIMKARFNIEMFIYSQTIAYLITAAIALSIVLRKSQFFKLRLDKKYFLLIVKKSLPFSILVLLMSVYNRMEPVLLERLLPDGKTQSGLYAQVFRILDALSNFSLLFPVLLLPLFSKMLKTKEDVNHLLRLACILMLVPVMALVTASVVYRNEIMLLLYHTQVSGSIFGLIIPGLIGISTTYIFGTLLTANGNLKELNIMAVSAVTLNLTLNLILIPLFEVKGAAFSSLITQTITALAQVIMAWKILNLKVNFSVLIRLLVFSVLIISGSILVKNSVHSWLTGFIIIASFAMVISFALRLLRLKELSLIFIRKSEI